jgi:hypothetical protein
VVVEAEDVVEGAMVGEDEVASAAEVALAGGRLWGAVAVGGEVAAVSEGEVAEGVDLIYTYIYMFMI